MLRGSHVHSPLKASGPRENLVNCTLTLEGGSGVREACIQRVLHTHARTAGDSPTPLSLLTGTRAVLGRQLSSTGGPPTSTAFSTAKSGPKGAISSEFLARRFATSMICHGEHHYERGVQGVTDSALRVGHSSTREE